ncbi:hypothetical protein PPERSA_04429 [Pseudocohnilembus persalinus]|uniref:Uncharacterized protein n=1 Tax=Pseudocohnilembus persalinus TaxID=266149 RepID=A0A0V0QQT9_PSEPJ|nr:hypothetical protein PPERSA_04429 [Pseudocohnilembus persalinus]|eukprot:KRX04614.1 hypothetical protein PPERSA_04429 [Pseudocohnilembus persalinus]
MSKDWLLKQINEIFNQQFQKEVAHLASVQQSIKKKIIPFSNFPTFVFNYFYHQMSGLSLKVEEMCANLLVTLNFYEEKLKYAEIFSQFLKEEYDKDDLVYMLFIRTVVQKVLIKDFYMEQASQNKLDQVYLNSQKICKILNQIFGNGQQDKIHHALSLIQPQMQIQFDQKLARLQQNQSNGNQSQQDNDQQTLNLTKNFINISVNEQNQNYDQNQSPQFNDSKNYNFNEGEYYKEIYESLSHLKDSQAQINKIIYSKNDIQTNDQLQYNQNSDNLYKNEEFSLNNSFGNTQSQQQQNFANQNENNFQKQQKKQQKWEQNTNLLNQNNSNNSQSYQKQMQKDNSQKSVILQSTTEFQNTYTQQDTDFDEKKNNIIGQNQVLNKFQLHLSGQKQLNDNLNKQQIDLEQLEQEENLLETKNSHQINDFLNQNNKNLNPIKNQKQLLNQKEIQDQSQGQNQIQNNFDIFQNQEQQKIQLEKNNFNMTHQQQLQENYNTKEIEKFLFDFKDSQKHIPLVYGVQNRQNIGSDFNMYSEYKSGDNIYDYGTYNINEKYDTQNNQKLNYQYDEANPKKVYDYNSRKMNQISEKSQNLYDYLLEEEQIQLQKRIWKEEQELKQLKEEFQQNNQGYKGNTHLGSQYENQNQQDYDNIQQTKQIYQSEQSFQQTQQDTLRNSQEKQNKDQNKKILTNIFQNQQKVFEATNQKELDIKQLQLQIEETANQKLDEFLQKIVLVLLETLFKNDKEIWKINLKNNEIQIEDIQFNYLDKLNNLYQNLENSVKIFGIQKFKVDEEKKKIYQQNLNLLSKGILQTPELARYIGKTFVFLSEFTDYEIN